MGSLPPSRDTQRKTRAKADGPLEEEQLLLTLLTGTIRASHSAPQTRGQAEECVEGKGPCRGRHAGKRPAGGGVQREGCVIESCVLHRRGKLGICEQAVS